MEPNVGTRVVAGILRSARPTRWAGDESIEETPPLAVLFQS